MKLIRLKSIANNAIRDSIWTPELIGFEPFSTIRPKDINVVDLISGKLTPDLKGDDVEKYYQAMSRWFHQALPKEGIPLEAIESATITISPSGKKCEIQAGGKSFTAEISF